MQPSSKCALSKACCWSLGDLGKAWFPSCRPAPSLFVPPPQLPAADTPTHLGAHPPIHPDSRATRLLGLQRQDDGSRPPCVAGLVRDLRERPGARITGTQSDEAERSEDPTLSVSSRSLARSSVCHRTRPDCPDCPEQSRAIRIRKCAGPSFEFWIDSLPISRIWQAAPDHNLLPSYNVHCTHYNAIVSRPRGADRYYHLNLFHMSSSSLSSYSIRNQNQAKAVRQLSQPVVRSTLHVYKGPTLCSRWFGMSDENRHVLDFVAQIPKEPGVKRPSPSHSSTTQVHQHRNLAVQQFQFRRSPA